MRGKSTILLYVFAAAASANTVTFDTVDRGYYRSDDTNTPSNQNYLTGQINIPPPIGFHSFFTFGPLVGLNGPIVGATLNLFNPQGGYSSPQASEQLTIDQFSGNIAALDTAGSGAGSVPGEYNALASGTTLGTQSVGAADDGKVVTITLNSAAISFLNSNSSGMFAFGGYLKNLNTTDTRFVFGASNFSSPLDGNTYLILKTASAVPEPSMAFFLVPMLAGFIVVLRIRKASSTVPIPPKEFVA